MYRVIAAQVYYDQWAPEKFGILVKLNKPNAGIHHNFEKRHGIYRAQEGDLVRFFSYTEPGNGYGGWQFNIHLTDGSHEHIIGPWSSRAGVVNMLYPDRDAVIECTEDNIVTCVTVESLRRLGIEFYEITKWGGEQYFIPAQIPELITYQDAKTRLMLAA